MSYNDLHAAAGAIALKAVERALHIIETGDNIGHEWPFHGQQGARIDAAFERIRQLREGVQRQRSMESGYQATTRA